MTTPPDSPSSQRKQSPAFSSCDSDQNVRPVQRRAVRSNIKHTARLAPVCAAFVCALFNTLVAQTPTRQKIATTRPLLIMIHGRSQSYQVSDLLRKTWFGALDDGLRKIASPNVIPEADRRFIYYGDVFEHQTRSHSACFDVSTGMPYERTGFNPVASPLARYFLSGDRTDLVSAIRRVAGKIKGSAYFVAAQLPDVLSYHDDRFVQCEIESRLVSLLDSAKASQREVVIVAHSMGALVTFHTLLRRPPGEWPRIRALITIGSPLASPGMPAWLADAETIDDIWKVPGKNARDSILARWHVGMLHNTIGYWTNVLGQDDQLAYPVKKASELATIADTLYDIMVETEEGDEHGVVGYLKNPWVASAIAREWCPPPPDYASVCHLLSPTDSTIRVPTTADNNIRIALGLEGSFGALSELQQSDTSSTAGLGPALYAFSPFFPGMIEYRLPSLHEKAKNHGMVEKPWLLARFQVLAGIQFVWGKIGSYEVDDHWVRSSVRGWGIGTTDLEGSALNTMQVAYLRQRDNQHRHVFLASFAVAWAPAFLKR
jgi:pimeloyl-ACP methyl ester carboxylesterase